MLTGRDTSQQPSAVKNYYLICRYALHLSNHKKLFKCFYPYISGTYSLARLVLILCQTID